MSVKDISIKVGQKGEEFLQTNNLNSRANVQRQPAGLNFYKYRWPMDDRGTVHLDNGGHSFSIPGVLSLQGTEDEEHLSQGIFAYSVSFAPSGGGEVLHNEVRLEFLGLLSDLRDKGWRRVIAYDDPRLSGEAAYRYYLNSSMYSVPIDYELSLDDWMGLDGLTSWTLHADGVFVGIQFYRDKSKMNPEEAGSYLFTMVVESKEEYAKSYFKSEDRDRWEELWVEAIGELKRMRMKQEKKLKEADVQIDTDYRDPKIHPDDPITVE